MLFKNKVFLRASCACDWEEKNFASTKTATGVALILIYAVYTLEHVEADAGSVEVAGIHRRYQIFKCDPNFLGDGKTNLLNFDKRYVFIHQIYFVVN